MRCVRRVGIAMHNLLASASLSPPIKTAYATSRSLGVSLSRRLARWFRSSTRRPNRCPSAETTTGVSTGGKPAVDRGSGDVFDWCVSSTADPLPRSAGAGGRDAGGQAPQWSAGLATKLTPTNFPATAPRSGVTGADGHRLVQRDMSPSSDRDAPRGGGFRRLPDFNGGPSRAPIWAARGRIQGHNRHNRRHRRALYSRDRGGRDPGAVPRRYPAGCRLIHQSPTRNAIGSMKA